MSKKIYINDRGKIRRYNDLEAAEKILKLRKEKGPWSVISELINLWAERFPDEVSDTRENLKQYRESARDLKFGQTAEGGDAERRFTMAFPRTLLMLIRTQYKPDELPFDRAFIREFRKRFPEFKVAEKD